MIAVQAVSPPPPMIISSAIVGEVQMVDNFLMQNMSPNQASATVSSTITQAAPPPMELATGFVEGEIKAMGPVVKSAGLQPY